MKKTIFLLSIVYLPTLIAMEIESLSQIKTVTICTNIDNALNNDIKNALAKLKPINQLNQVLPHIVDIFPLPYTELYLQKLYGQKTIIKQILLPKDNPKAPIQLNCAAPDIVISLAGLHCVKNKYKKKLFNDVAQSLIKGGQALFCISAKPNEYHTAIQAFEKLKTNSDFNYVSAYKITDGYHYITPEKAKKYLKKAGLTECEITPYTRTITFENASIFERWLGSWMPSLPAFKYLADDKKIAVITAFVKQYLQDNPPNLDKTITYSYSHLLIRAEK